MKIGLVVRHTNKEVCHMHDVGSNTNVMVTVNVNHFRADNFAVYGQIWIKFGMVVRCINKVCFVV